MKKQDIINEMKAKLVLYKTIKPEEFNFHSWVTEYNKIHNCGTICCLWGSEPRLNPEGQVKWEKSKYSESILNVNHSPNEILEWGEKIISYLYYGYNSDNEGPNYIYEISFITKILLSPFERLERVLNTWECVINMLETSELLDEFLNLD